MSCRECWKWLIGFLWSDHSFVRHITHAIQVIDRILQAVVPRCQDQGRRWCHGGLLACDFSRQLAWQLTVGPKPGGFIFTVLFV